MTAPRATDVPCCVEGCGRTGRLTRKMCLLHYNRWYRTGDAGESEYRYGGSGKRIEKGRVCSVDGCDLKHDSRGYCSMHVQRFRRNGVVTLEPRVYTGKNAPCSLAECTRRADRRGWCREHEPQRVPAKYGPGRWVYGDETNPYIAVPAPSHPNAWKNGRVPEHVLVFTEWLGRPLQSGENIHHKNGVRHDNSLSNLELWVVSQPAGQRPEDLVAWAREILERYEDYHGPAEE
jgi:hypothetical protein